MKTIKTGEGSVAPKAQTEVPLNRKLLEAASWQIPDVLATGGSLYMLHNIRF